MKKVSELDFGFSDAENYKRRENKEKFQKFFVKNEYLDRILDPSISFIIGEKGTGKTAYATFISNTSYKNTGASIKFIRETEYKKFVEMKKDHNLGLSDYTEIWRTILLLMFCESIVLDIESKKTWKMKSEIKEIKSAINEFYNNAFSPEIITALKFVENPEISAKLISKYAEIGGKISETKEVSGKVFQTSLLYLRRKFEDVILSAKIGKDLVLFVDGIDIRPSNIDFDDYLDCIKGLANAIWTLNNDLFPQVKDSKGRLRIVLLVRTDIFLKLGLQNPNTKIRDNAVVLDWITTYNDYRNSGIFEVIDNLLSAQQDSQVNLGDAWDNYFPFFSPNVNIRHRNDSSFIYFLRKSYYRPRDIITHISIFKDNIPRKEVDEFEKFSVDYCNNRAISNLYAEYLLGELRDQLVFYYSDEEYEDFVQFFDFLDGNIEFSYDQYVQSYNRYVLDLEGRDRVLPEFVSRPNKFLQFLYELNVVSFTEISEQGEEFMHWSFRERSLGKIAPKVKSHCKYRIHNGLVPALNVGQRIKSSRKGG